MVRGGRVAFSTWSGGRFQTVHDGVRGPLHDMIFPPLVMSRDGSVVAYAAREGARQFVVVAGRAGPDWYEVGTPVLTPDGAVHAYPARKGDRWRIVRGSESGPEWGEVGRPALSEDGTRMAYRARRGRDRFLVVDGQAGDSWEWVGDPVLSRDGSVAACVVQRGGRRFLRHGERMREVGEAAGEALLSVDGRHAGWIEEADGRRRVRAEGHEGPWSDWIGWPAVLPDGRILYFCRGDDTKLLIVGARTVDLGPGVVLDPELDPERGRIGFGIRDGRRLVWRTLDF